jgi:DNA-binding CsgD family transcriptional regulator
MEERLLQRIDQKLTMIVGLLFRMQRESGVSASAEAIQLHQTGLTPEEIARALGKTPEAVYKALQRGGIKLRFPRERGKRRK